MAPALTRAELLRVVRHLEQELEILEPTIAHAQATLQALAPDFDRLVIEWTRAERLAARQAREDRFYATLVDAEASEQAQVDAARVIAATYPMAFSGRRRKYRAWIEAAQYHERHPRERRHHAWLREMLAVGLRDTVRRGLHLTVQDVKLGERAPDASSTRITFRIHRRIRPIDLPPHKFRRWLMRQAFRCVEDWFQADSAALE